jgi:DNA-binding transcriptional LysR family regulator
MTEGGRSAWQGIEVRHLAALQALAEESSFHGAARRLGYSQPAVSQQLAALERIVGKKLVNRPRVSQPLTLTDAGQRLLACARAIQASLAVAEADLLAAVDGGPLRIGAYQTIAAHLLPHVFRELAYKTPNVRLLLTETPEDEKLARLLDGGELDLAFIDLPLRLPRDFATESLATDAYVLVVPSESSRAREGRPVKLGELADFELIGFKSSGSTHRVIAHLRGRGIEPRFALRSDDNSVVQGFVAAGFGAALIPSLAASLWGSEFAVLRFESQLPPRVIGLAWLRDLSSVPAARVFVATTRKVVARLWKDGVVDGADNLASFPAPRRAVAGESTIAI